MLTSTVMFDGYSIPPHVMSDTLDGETIVINALTGSYYTFDEMTGSVWSGISTPTIVSPSVDEHDVLAALVVEGLAVGPDSLSRLSDREVFVKYTDMEELLLADPIHEVDDRGWPLLRQ